jgi:cytochrome c-type biogenesis protein CcmF
MFPVLSEAVQGVKITVGAPFFNKVNVPIAIFLLFLTGVGPLLAWRKASTNSLKRIFLWPAVMSRACGVVLYFTGVNGFFERTENGFAITSRLYAWLSLVTSIFVAITIVREFYKGARARSSGTGENFMEAVVNLTLRNTRRYGGYIAHFGFVLLFVGWAGQAFTTDVVNEVGVGDTFSIRQYTLRIETLTTEETPNYFTNLATVGVFENGRKVAVMHPERRLYKASQQSTTEVSIRSTIKEDLYLVYAAPPPAEGGKAIVQVFLNPLVMWVWIGGIVLGLGTLIALLPNQKISSAKRARTPVEESKEVEVHTP